jgi:hypothetical protein
MSFKNSSRGSLVGLALMLCLAPAAQAGTHDAGRARAAVPARAHREGVLQALWSELAHLFGESGSAIVLGTPGSPAGPATDSEGASIDPSGVH